MEPNKNNSSILKAFTALVVVGLGSLGLWKLSVGDEDNKPLQQPVQGDTSAPINTQTPGTQAVSQKTDTDDNISDDEDDMVPRKTTPNPIIGNGGGANSATTNGATASAKYKDGTYSATGNYNSPEGGEQVSVSVTLKNGVITNSTFAGQSSSGRSQSYMNRFSAGFTTLVVGKPIDQVSLTVVNGASLTPIGFMNALARIKTQAKV